jgi:phage-related protein
VGPANRPLVWLHGAVKTPPFTADARTEAGLLLRRLQRGEALGLPHARPMSTIGPRCGELRIPDADASWRIVYRLDPDAVVILAVFAKKAAATPKAILEACAARLKLYDRNSRSGGA